MIKPSQFKAAWWLSSPHLQTIWPFFFPKVRQKLVLRRERLTLPDGDFLDLDWTIPPATQDPIILVMHGLGGSVESHYAQGLLWELQLAGYQAVAMHFRSCSGELNRLARFYHSGDTADLAYICELLCRRYPYRPLIAVGYSLGGNVLLKWLGETGQENPLSAGIAISVPFELEKAANHINWGMGRFYQWWLLKKLRVDFKQKFTLMKTPLSPDILDQCHDFWSFDHYITAPLHGFESVYDYYKASSSRYYLKDIVTPTLIIHATDDPFMPSTVIPSEEELSPFVELELSEKGGHVGFIGGSSPIWPRYYLDERILAYIKTVIF